MRFTFSIHSVCFVAPVTTPVMSWGPYVHLHIWKGQHVSSDPSPQLSSWPGLDASKRLPSFDELKLNKRPCATIFTSLPTALITAKVRKMTLEESVVRQQRWAKMRTRVCDLNSSWLQSHTVSWELTWDFLKRHETRLGLKIWDSWTIFILFFT